MTKPALIVQIPTRRYSLEHSLALWRKKTDRGLWYVVGPKGTPPVRGWAKSMREAIRLHRERRTP